MEEPYIRVEETGELFPLQAEVTTVGRGRAVDVRLVDPSVSRLHAEIVRRGPYAYVVDLGLSRNGTRVNGRPVARRVLEDGDVVSFGSARCRVVGIPHEDLAPEVELRRSASPELTRRELDVLTSLCRPALSDEAFVAPATAREIAADLVVTEAAVKQHLLRLYQKFRIPEGPNRRTRLANEVVALGLVRPLPPASGTKPETARVSTSGAGALGPAGGAGSGSTGSSAGPPGAGAQGTGSAGAQGTGGTEAKAMASRSADSGRDSPAGGSPDDPEPSGGPSKAGPDGNESLGRAGAAGADPLNVPRSRAAEGSGNSRPIRGADRGTGPARNVSRRRAS